ncbi:SDR family oxidoreductase [Idiomarina sp.]|uniref:SDR family oxidoreductase n=1 Tax=Idiomarina sp. TaxID=1874361 RepID=UPI0025BFE1F1|nr:SDR family oxidoreductase [Idiomarina sp.]
MKSIDWSRQTIVLTGASGGLGEALAEAFGKKGAHLILVGRSAEKLEALAARLQQTPFVADITAHSERQRLYQFIQQQARPLTGLINNAAVTHEGLFRDASAEDIELVISTNLTAPVALTHQLLPLLSNEQGWALNVGSVFGAIGFPGQALYCASKFGLRGFTQALQRELKPSDVRVMYAAPRALKTSLNHGVLNRLNQRLNTAQDQPQQVAQQLVKQIERQQLLQTLGWPERLLVRLNGLWPEQVSRSLGKTRNMLYQLIEEYRHEKN